MDEWVVAEVGTEVEDSLFTRLRTSPSTSAILIASNRVAADGVITG